MPHPPVPTVWIIGTSVSIEEGGYVSRLTTRIASAGGIVTNLSVGDQTSMMGYMRTLENRHRFRRGDVVVWEYSLLDVLLTEPGENIFDTAQVQLARRLAWKLILDSKCRLIVLMTPPRKYLQVRTDREQAIAEDAATLGIPCIDGRDLFHTTGMTDAASHYRDDRHPLHSSSIIDAMVDAVFACTGTASGIDTRALSAWSECLTKTRWEWSSAEQLARRSRQTLMAYRNSLVEIDAVSLSPGSAVPLGSSQRVVAAGIVSTHASGRVWCGHANCAAASARLPEDLPYAFLLRVTQIPCKCESTTTLRCVDNSASTVDSWSDYGQSPFASGGPVAIFGILHERSDSAPGWRRWLNWRRKPRD